MRLLWVVAHLFVQDARVAQGVDKGCATSARSTFNFISLVAKKLCVLLFDDIYVPTTMSVNWKPFFTFFLRPPSRYEQLQISPH